MAGRKVDIESKIDHQEEVLSKLKERYDEAAAELEELMAKREETQKKELMEAFSKSSRSYEDVLAFLQGIDKDAPEQPEQVQE